VSGETDLARLLAGLEPALLDGDYVFLSCGDDVDPALQPLATFREPEGWSIVVRREDAERLGFPIDAVFRGIRLSVHSSLQAVGLTAAVAGRLAGEGISANVIAAYFHDYVFVPRDQASRALEALRALSREDGPSASRPLSD